MYFGASDWKLSIFFFADVFYVSATVLLLPGDTEEGSKIAIVEEWDWYKEALGTYY
jgi:hypothetical protein